MFVLACALALPLDNSVVLEDSLCLLEDILSTKLRFMTREHNRTDLRCGTLLYQKSYFDGCSYSA